MSDAPPETIDFELSAGLNADAIQWVKLPEGDTCANCRKRGGWFPRVWQSDCPMCLGEDPYGQSSYCADCEYCCGC